MKLGAVSAIVFTASTAAAQSSADTSSLVARLGVDTIAVERILKTARTVEAEITVRSPRTTLQHHKAQFGPDGSLSTLEVSILDPATSEVTRRTAYTREADSIRVVDVQGDKRTTRAVAATAAVLPFIDLVHWPFDVALRRLRTSGSSAVEAPMLSGSRVSAFPLAIRSGDSATVTHPTRGTMRLTLMPDGSIRTLDAGATTRALVVTRVKALDVASLARDYAARDAAGKGVGELSGRGGGPTSVLGANIVLDYGTPSRRGRDIWGVLVKYGNLWRTGANTATHFSTDKPLRFGTLDVPAGKYTLYSIPEADGGWLIINKQTGQNGQQYDKSQDLGRVRLRARDLHEPVETFTISAREEAGRGLLGLQWDRRELVTEFEPGR